MSAQSPDEILAAASAAAAEMLPKLEAEHAALMAQGERLMTKITRLRAIMSVAPSLATPAQVPKQEEFSLAQQDIESVLRSDGPLRVADIHDHIFRKFNRKWGDSTLYNHLTNGKNSGRYINEAKLWRLAE